jgi:hypothetical protein
VLDFDDVVDTIGGFADSNEDDLQRSQIVYGHDTIEQHRTPSR